MAPEAIAESSNDVHTGYYMPAEAFESTASQLARRTDVVVLAVVRLRAGEFQN